MKGTLSASSGARFGGRLEDERPVRDHVIALEQWAAKQGYVPPAWPNDDEPPRDPFTVALEVDCTRIDPAQMYVYRGDPGNGQGPRHPDQLVAMVDADGTPFLRWRSEPIDHDVNVWDAKTKAMRTVHAGEYCSAGVQLKAGGPTTYGALEVELRAVQASDGTRFALGWFPTHAWPHSESDIVECSGDGQDRYRSGFGTNLHYVDDEGEHQQHQERAVVDLLGGWHSVRAEWTPGLVVVTLDGAEVQRFTEDVPGLEDSPMFPFVQTALQSAQDGLARPGTAPGGLDVRALRLYSWTPPTP